MFNSIKKYISNLYFQYEMVTCIYMFEPWEKRLINGFFLFILALFTFSSIVYLPKYIETFVQFLSPLPPSTGYSPTYQAEKMSSSR
ncbi:serine palmitoyltransferase small subunit B [Eupeodes corollae]|uniref:serine palmitoyltransferase small subunit B n=1 Tax=Eupeodes corollae TaxID=290404 RepID=UPI002492749B|nr:serine palmitoyltransferase small subunit B [Eupeodes corollae]